MRSYVPGEHGWTDHGPRTTVHPDVQAYKAPKSVKNKDGTFQVLRHPKHYSFDRLNEGTNNAGTSGLVLIERSKRSDAEEEYLAALHEVFHNALGRLNPTHRAYLRGAMEGKSTRDHARELDVSQPAVVQGRKRALDALAKALGAKGLEDRPGIRQGIVRGTNFNITEWLPGFTEGAGA